MVCLTCKKYSDWPCLVRFETHRRDTKAKCSMGFSED